MAGDAAGHITTDPFPALTMLFNALPALFSPAAPNHLVTSRSVGVHTAVFGTWCARGMVKNNALGDGSGGGSASASGLVAKGT